MEALQLHMVTDKKHDLRGNFSNEDRVSPSIQDENMTAQQRFIFKKGGCALKVRYKLELKL